MASDQTYSYSRRHRALEVACITLFFAVTLALGAHLAQTTRTPQGLVWLALAGLLGYLTADFLSGIVHWAGDTVGDESWPVVGKNFITHFRYHHVDPKDITRHDFIETNGNNCIVSLPPLTSALLLAPEREGPGLFFTALITFTSLFVFATNQFHKWAHADEPPRVARWLQRARLILSPGHHQIHHNAPHDRYYCITVGWMNPILTRLRFFRAVEWLLKVVKPGILHLEERGAPGGVAAVRRDS